MSYWNFRIVSEVVGDHTDYFISEVYYDNAGNPKSWTESDNNPLTGWDNVEDLRSTVEAIHLALEKPVLRVIAGTLREV